MSVSLKISFNNNIITNNSYTKFLGVTMNNTLSQNNHIELTIKELSKACYIIRKAEASGLSRLWKWFIVLFFTRSWAMELHFGETHCTAQKFLGYKKRQLELWKDVEIEFRVETCLRNLKFCPWYRSTSSLY